MSQDLFEQESSPDNRESGMPAREGDARFREISAPHAPLAERVRPSDFADFLGQDDLLGAGRPLRRLLEGGRVPSMIFWGPPGCGKTTLALLLARTLRCDFVVLSAVSAQISDVRRVINQATLNLRHARRTILFVDEIHRFNKAQQDGFLPAVEAGTIILIGATTENPSFSVIGPLLSRCRVFVLKALGVEDLKAVMRRAMSDARAGLAELGVTVGDEVLEAIAAQSDGDARRALTLLEISAGAARAQNSPELTAEILAALSQRHFIYDKSGEEHYNLISALHKSLRSSDPQAALYWLARMLVSGEDPLYVARRMIRFASEDVGLADPQALVQTLAAYQAYHTLGSPEGELALVQAAIYLATAPKSNSLYAAEGAVRAEIESTGSLPAPMTLRNAPTSLMKELGYGADYTYDHNSEEHYIPKRCLPDGVESETFYTPGPFGFEKEIRRRLDWWAGLRRARQEGESGAEGGGSLAPEEAK